MTIFEKQTEIEQVEKAINPLAERLAKLKSELEVMESLDFIDDHKITRADVEQPNEGSGNPFFETINEFIAWLRHTNCKKRFTEWNGTIYFTSDLIANKMPPMPGRMKDLAS